MLAGASARDLIPIGESRGFGLSLFLSLSLPIPAQPECSRSARTARRECCGPISETSGEISWSRAVHALTSLQTLV